MASLPFVLILYSLCARRTENEDHPVIIGIHSFCSYFIGESAGYIWQFKIGILNLCDKAIEHQNSSVDYAPFNFMKSWCTPALRLHFVSCSMHWKWWKAEQVPGYKATALCIIIMILGKSLINTAACVRACVCVHLWDGEVSTSLIAIALYVNLN